MKIIGEPIDRVDGRKKVTGAAEYAAETKVADVAYGVIVSSAAPKGKIKSIDADAATKTPGVIAILTHDNAMKAKQTSGKGPVDRNLQLLQDALVRYARQPIALVVADTFERATEAANTLGVTFDVEAPNVDMDATLDEQHAPKKSASTTQGPPEFNKGDADKGSKEAATKLEATYTTPFEHHNPMEMHATVAAWQGDKLTLYDATQGIFGVRSRVAAALDVSKDDIRVISKFLGGGFGCKGSCWSHVVLAAMAARQLKRPVKIMLTRAQMFAFVGGRPRTVQNVMLGAKKDGALTLVKHESVSPTSSFDEFVEHTTSPTRALYATPNLHTRERLVKLDIGTPTFQRAPGESTGQFAIESAMDELSYLLKMDPVALRLKNHADVDPESGKPWSSKSLKECYRAASEKFGWSKRSPEPRSMRDGRELVGYGMATATYPAHFWPASALARVDDTGRVTVLAGSQDIGTGTYTIMTQIAAGTLGVPVDRVFFDLGDTTMPETPVSGGSNTATSVGSAVRGACEALKKQIDDLSKPDHGTKESIEAILKRAGKKELEAKYEAKPSAERDKYATRAFGAVFVEARVDQDLGKVRVARVVAAYACGRILNAKTAESQMMGGLVWGIGMALLEESKYDLRYGRVMNADLAEYLVPTNADVPKIEILQVHEDDPHVNELGVKGLGEIPICGAAAAIANAVFHATGKRVRDLPITLDKLL